MKQIRRYALQLTREQFESLGSFRKHKEIEHAFAMFDSSSAWVWVYVFNRFPYAPTWLEGIELLDNLLDKSTLVTVVGGTESLSVSSTYEEYTEWEEKPNGDIEPDYDSETRTIEVRWTMLV